MWFQKCFKIRFWFFFFFLWKVITSFSSIFAFQFSSNLLFIFQLRFVVYQKYKKKHFLKQKLKLNTIGGCEETWKSSSQTSPDFEYKPRKSVKQKWGLCGNPLLPWFQGCGVINLSRSENQFGGEELRGPRCEIIRKQKVVGERGGGGRLYWGGHAGPILATLRHHGSFWLYYFLWRRLGFSW